MYQRRTQAREVKVGVGGVVLNDHRVLLHLRQRSPEAGYWSLPGGSVNFQKPVEHALVRELVEELGINVEIETLLCVASVSRQGCIWNPNKS
jgi:ADP-ribose pyrophosphatase